MAILKRGNASIYYEEIGQGPPVLVTHGLTENTTYWSLSGITARLAARHRVIAADMRGHGRTVVHGEPQGFDAENAIEDLIALADALELERFSLLSHSTGGMVSVRLAMKHGGRLERLILTDSSSHTAVVGGGEEASREAREGLASVFDGRSWDEIVPLFRLAQEGLLAGLNKHPEPDRVWGLADRMFRVGDPETIAAFIRSFYTDPDRLIDGLRGIACPTLVIVGEHDAMFLEACKLMAREIPDARLLILEGIGHMIALEAPDATANAVLEFLEEGRQ